MSATATQLRLPIPTDGIPDFCRKWNVTRFESFGSVLRDDFGPASDVDVMVTFNSGNRVTAYTLLDMGDELSVMFGRTAHLATREALLQTKKKKVRDAVFESLQVLYAI